MTNTQWIHTSMTNRTKCNHEKYTVELHHERKHSHRPIVCINFGGSLPPTLSYVSPQHTGPAQTHAACPHPLRCCHVAKGNPTWDSSSSSHPMGDSATNPSFSTVRSFSGPHPMTPKSQLLQVSVMSRRGWRQRHQGYTTPSSTSQHWGEGGPPPFLTINAYPPHLTVVWWWVSPVDHLSMVSRP